MYKGNIKIRFSDCDAGGRIFFSRIFEYAHIVFEDLINEKYSGKDFFASSDFAVPIIKCSAVFHKPIFLHSELEVAVTVSSLSTHAFSLSYSFEQDKNIYAKVETVHVFVNKNNSKISIPEDFKNFLMPLMVK
ncbi:MAG: hypothetical protein Fur0015_12160 [Ignavibacteriales bacterium]